MTTRNRRGRPARTDEGREAQLISRTMDLVEKQIQEGSASAQVLSHFLKLGSSREKLEQQQLRRNNELLTAKVEAMASAKRVEELYAKALDAMRSYAGHPDPIDDPYEDDDVYD